MEGGKEGGAKKWVMNTRLLRGEANAIVQSWVHKDPTTPRFLMSSYDSFLFDLLKHEIE